MPPLLGGFAGGLIGGGADLGNAHGTITLDVSDLDRAAQVAGRVGQNIERNLGGVGRTATRIAGDIRAVRTELLALGAAGGVLATIGLRTAASLEEAEIRLRGMVGSQEEANALMKELQEQASAAGVPFSDMLSVATMMLPTLEGNTEELEKWFDIVRRTATLNQREGLAGAAFAIREALTSGGTDLVSLAERFNISRIALREALVQTGGDFQAALDIVLTQMGITTQVADEMGQSFNAAFRVARDAAAQALAAGFRPFLEALTPILQRTGEWLSQLSQTSPALLTLGASLISVVAVGAPLLVFLGQVIESLQKIRALSIAGTLGQAGIAGAAIIGGAVIGNQIGRGIGRATGNEEVAATGLSDVVRTIGQVLFIAADSFTKIAYIIGAAFYLAAQRFTEGIGRMLVSIGEFINRVSEFVPGQAGMDLRETGWRTIFGGEALLRKADELDGALGEIAANAEEKRQELLLAFGRFIGVIDDAATETEAATAGGVGAGGLVPFSEEQLARIQAWDDFQADLAEIEATAAAQRLQATAQFEAQRAQVEAAYQLQRAREAEDFQRNRARQDAQLEASIGDILAEQRQREEDWFIELYENRIPELRQQSAERILKMEEEAAVRRERAQRNHLRNLTEAAANLDAEALWREQLRFDDEMTDLESDLQRRIEQERENLEERIAQEEEAHQQRIQQARQADEKRIADMRAAHAEMQRLEDEDRAIRLARMQEDHEAQLGQLGIAHQARMDQIDEQEREALETRTQAFREQAIALSDFYDDWLITQHSRQQESLTAFDNFLRSIRDSISRQMSLIPGNPYGGPYDDIPSGPNPTPSPGNRMNAQELGALAVQQMQAAGWSPTAIARQIQAMGTWSAEQIARWLELTFGLDIPGYLAGVANVPRTGLALLHQGEAVLPPAMAASLRMMAGFSGAQMSTGLAGSSSVTHVSVAAGAFAPALSINNGMSERQVLELFDRALTDFWGQVRP